MGLTVSEALFWDQTWFMGRNNDRRMDFTSECLGSPHSEFFYAFKKLVGIDFAKDKKTTKQNGHFLTLASIWILIQMFFYTLASHSLLQMKPV